MTQGDQSRRRRLSWSWAILAVVYAVFFFWYTSFGGPLRDEEIAHYTEVLAEAPEVGDRSDRWIRFMESDTGNDFAMWNAVDLLDTPRPVEGVEPGDTSQDVVNRYSEPFFSQALGRASHPVMGGARPIRLSTSGESKAVKSGTPVSWFATEVGVTSWR